MKTVTDVVVDVETSKVQDLRALLRDHGGSREDVDGFVAPGC